MDSNLTYDNLTSAIADFHKTLIEGESYKPRTTHQEHINAITDSASILRIVYPNRDGRAFKYVVLAVVDLLMDAYDYAAFVLRERKRPVKSLRDELRSLIVTRPVFYGGRERTADLISFVEQYVRSEQARRDYWASYSIFILAHSVLTPLWAENPDAFRESPLGGFWPEDNTNIKDVLDNALAHSRNEVRAAIGDALCQKLDKAGVDVRVELIEDRGEEWVAYLIYQDSDLDDTILDVILEIEDHLNLDRQIRFIPVRVGN